MAANDDEDDQLRAVTLQNTQSILNARRGLEEALRKQSEWLRITLASIGDAVISTDPEGRVTFMNGVAEALTGWPQADAVGLPLPDVFQIVNEITRQPVKNPALRAVREGTVVGLANQTILISRDGLELPIDDCASPLRDESGTAIGAVLVFRDVTERKRAEELRARLAAIVESTEDAIVGKTLDGIIRSWNASAERLFGYSAKEAVGQPINLIIPPERIEEEHAILDRLRRGERVESFDTIRLAKDGRRLELSLTISPIRDASGRVIGASKIARDIGERKRAEKALRESEARYRAIVESSPECVKLVARDGTLLQMNRAGLAMIEATEAEAMGHSMYNVIAPEQRDAFRAFNERVCRGEGGQLDFDIVGLRGTRRHMETTAVPLPAPDGEFNHLAVTRDSTERVEAARELRESEERYRRAAIKAAQAAEANAKFRAFFEQGTTLAAVLALDGTVVEANRLFLESCGFAREEVMGKPFWLCGWWNQSPALMDMVREACLQAAAARLFRTELKYSVTAGNDRVVDLILAPVTDSEGHVLFVAATGSDVTERRQMENTLREADRRKDEFLALLAHELRNPLAPVCNGLQVMRLAGSDTTAVAQARGMMERQLAQMVRLVDDLLDISRISCNKMELRRSRVLLADVVSCAVETSRPMIEAAGHQLTVSLPQQPVLLDADLTRLAQVFGNLLSNSAKYTQPGGRIWLTAERAKGWVSVAVRDTGIGIPSYALPSIFEMFSQVDRSIERSTGGLGIGLALVKGLVEMHGGTVEAVSAGLGAGSTFNVRLPILEERVESPLESPVEDGWRASGVKRRVLVVDDNRDSANSMALVLRLRGDEVRTAHNGFEAVQLAEAFRPQVILMDVGMPQLNGYEATRCIRKQRWGQAAAIIALTGWGQEDDRVQSREAGCNGHLVKPVNLPELERLLAELTGGQTTGNN